MNHRSVSNIATLSRPALRLLQALSEEGAYARPDPARDDMLIVRSAGRGISLGRGAFPNGAMEELRCHELAARRGTEHHITETGRAFLRRGSAGRTEENRFGAQHRDAREDIVPGEGGPARVSVNAAESPLDWLRRRKGQDGEPMIDPASFEAGERLRRDLTFGGMLPAVTARWEGGGMGGSGGPRDPAGATDAVIAARQRARAALDAVGADFADLLLDLCGFLKGLETIERERRWPARSGKVVLRLALRRLAEHYGLETEARGPDRSRGLRSWTAEEASA